MKATDLLNLSLAGLWRQKLRTILTLLGVILGTTTLTVSLAIGIGVREVLEDQFRKEERLREITVFPNLDEPDQNESIIPEEVKSIQGELSEERRERLKQDSIRFWKRTASRRVPKPLTLDKLEELQAIPHVLSVVPVVDGIGRGKFNGRITDVHYHAIPADFTRVRELIHFGTTFTAEDAEEILVHEFLLYRWGIRNEVDYQGILGQTVELEIGNFRKSGLSLLSMFGADSSNITQAEMELLEKIWKQLPTQLDQMQLSPLERELFRKALDRKKPGEKTDRDIRIPKRFKIVGIFHSPPKKDKRDSGFYDQIWRDSEAFIPPQTGQNWHQQLPQIQTEGFLRVKVLVDSEANLKPVVEKIREMGYNEFSLGVFVEQVRQNAALIEFGMNFISLIALVVAAIGITNTLFTSVLERTKEIGIMKAVGATDRQIQLLFLFEGALIGLLGGLLGILFAWLVSIPGDQTAANLMQDQPILEGNRPKTVFFFQIWIVIGVPLFAMLMTTLAAWLPARRAARVDPVVALRHE